MIQVLRYAAAAAVGLLEGLIGAFVQAERFIMSVPWGLLVVPWGMVLVIAVLVIAGVLWSQKEGFGVPEFIDRRGAKNRRRDSASSYAQVTNHEPAAGPGPAPRGEPTGLRVGQWGAYTAPF